jgi:hypothetical protein
MEDKGLSQLRDLLTQNQSWCLNFLGFCHFLNDFFSIFRKVAIRDTSLIPGTSLVISIAFNSLYELSSSCGYTQY